MTEFILLMAAIVAWVYMAIKYPGIASDEYGKRKYKAKRDGYKKYKS